MAEIKPITCPECEKRFKPKTDVRGKKIKCPFCQAGFVVPKDEAAKEEKKAETAVKAAAPAGAAIGFADDDEDDGKGEYGATNVDLAPRCPNCAEEMVDENATVCLHCGYNTVERTWGQTQKTVSATGGERFLHLLPGIGTVFFICTVIVSLLIYCFYLPAWVAGSWMEMFDHESMRMWATLISMSLLWGSGFYCYKKFILEPKPAEMKKD